MDTLLKHNEPDLNAKLEVWECHKACEESAREARIKAEEELLPFFDSKEGGTKTFYQNGRKITITRKLDRKFDGQALNKIRDDIPEDLLPLKVSEVLDVKRLKFLQNNEPDTYRLISRAIVTTPAKAHIKIEKIKASAN